MEEERDYLVKRVYKDDTPTVIVEEDLTRSEARELVQEDIDEGDSSISMLVFDKM